MSGPVLGEQMRATGIKQFTIVWTVPLHAPCQHAIVRGNGESPFLPNHGFVTTVAVECLHCLEGVSARKGIGKSHLLSACHAVGALVSLGRHKNASSGLVGSCREPGVGITQAPHGDRSIAGQGRCDLVAESCPLTIPLLLINRRHLNAQNACSPAKSSSPLRRPQQLARPSTRILSGRYRFASHPESHRSRFR
jgi:hypothetical protein